MYWCVHMCRNDILLLLELKSACDACEFELQSLKHRRDGLPSDKQASISLPGVYVCVGQWSEVCVFPRHILFFAELVPQTPKKVRMCGCMYV